MGDLGFRAASASLRLLARTAHAALKAVWFLRRPRTLGAHAVAFSRAHRLILVKLRYAPGWRLPGGGRASDESASEAALRELREEIGMIAHGSVQLACELEESVDFKRDTAALVIVQDVEYLPRWSWEVEQVCEAALNNLPSDLSPRTARWLQVVSPHLQAPLGESANPWHGPIWPT
jgi:8-oxo-dGTP pyrophosphatase MutT (NUDIX family)